MANPYLNLVETINYLADGSAAGCAHVDGVEDELIQAKEGWVFARNQICEAGMAGTLKAKGRRRGSAVYEDIAADFWIDASIDPTIYPEGVVSSRQGFSDAVVYDAARFPREDVERLWPPASELDERPKPREGTSPKMINSWAPVMDVYMKLRRTNPDQTPRWLFDSTAKECSEAGSRDLTGEQVQRGLQRYWPRGQFG